MPSYTTALAITSIQKLVLRINQTFSHDTVLTLNHLRDTVFFTVFSTFCSFNGRLFLQYIIYWSKLYQPTHCRGSKKNEDSNDVFDIF